MNSQQRINEIVAFAKEEGITLPMPPEMIVYFEECGRIVDLETGKVYDGVTVQPSKHAQAVSYLLQQATGNPWEAYDNRH